jgi:hypothetical protein
MYRLTRDDGVELRVSGSIWEAALELAYLYGWRPAGTQTPQTEAWRGRRLPSSAPAWDSQDYFSRESQRVGRDDARFLAEAVLRALLHIPDGGPRSEPAGIAAGTVHPSPMPSRASAVAEGLAVSKRNVMRRFAAFADCGGFKIDSAL